MTSPLRCTAYHEAAHAVIYLYFGIEVEQVTLSPCGAGCCSVSNDLPPSAGRLLAILAGAEADKLLLAEHADILNHRKTGWATDLERAGDVFRLIGHYGKFEDAVEESARLVMDKWHTISSLAELWITSCEENFAAGDPLYIMMGHEVKSYVER